MASVVGGRDYRNISASTNQQGFQSVRASYIIQQADVNAEFVNVPVLWPTPFADVMYTVSAQVQDPQNFDDGNGFFIADFYFLATTGITVGIDLGEDCVAGTTVIIHAMAFHD